MRCGFWWTQIESWARDYGTIQYLAVRLIYAQICCGLIGSLGSFFNGVLLANLGISLFALIAIESSSQNLARTYAVLLFSSILLDISWLFLFSHYIWHMCNLRNHVVTGSLMTFAYFEVILLGSCSLIFLVCFTVDWSANVSSVAQTRASYYEIDNVVNEINFIAITIYYTFKSVVKFSPRLQFPRLKKCSTSVVNELLL
ncbi:hypothetical protein ACJIZ3_006137 [Penstemon smallii]|uniref:Uncharacterized protein n=1 Tax=Penstemon smallii TaxID=265156 RepID=A0ABD3S6X8_9LAMI